MRISDWSSDVCSSDLIPKEDSPDVSIPTLYVNMVHEGISPEDAGRLLIKPVEKELRALEGVKERTSTAYLGGANVVMEFDAGFDADKALADVREKVDLAKPELPEDTEEPTVHEINLSLFPVLTVSLAGSAPRSDVHTSELQSLMRHSYAVFCLTKKNTNA